MFVVRFIAEGDALQEVSLELASTWRAEFEGASPKLRASLNAWLKNYLAKKPAPIPFSLTGTPFQTSVWNALMAMPFGSTCSYSELAAKLGAPRAARAVGNACGQNRFLLLVPCHRVLHADGGIGGFACSLEIKKRLLEFERE